MPSHALMKGALTYIDAQRNPAQPLAFQYNPETLTRLQSYSEQAGTISESIRFRLVLSAVDAMDQGEPEKAAKGVYPQLAAMEELMARQTRRQRSSWLDWLRPPGPTGFVALMYGERVVPVRIQRLTLKELLHNERLEPVQATVDVALRVLDEEDLRGNAEGLATLNRYEHNRRVSAQQAETGPA